MTENTTGTFNLDPFSPICRGCLAESNEMKNIYEWGLFEDFFLFAGVPEMRSEGVSEQLCPSCVESLVSCTRFRDQCRRSDQLLRDTAKKKSSKEQSDDHNKINITTTLMENRILITISTGDLDSKIHLKCPFNCPKTFIKQRDLTSHMTKHHNETFQLDVRFHCPHSTCHYRVGNKHFSGRKYLNQHLNKVHRSRDITCYSCSTSFPTEVEYNRHCKTCNLSYSCAVCNAQYKTNERLIVHLSRRHPDIHQQYKRQSKINRGELKRCRGTLEAEAKKPKLDEQNADYMCDSPKRSFATQTLFPEINIKNDVQLSMWKSEDEDRNFSTIETQTVFEDLLSLKSQNSEDSLFFSEGVSLSDIRTQALEFGLAPKETITSETQTGTCDLSIKETQTCFCLLDSPRNQHKMAAETQTIEGYRSNLKSDVLLSFNSAETQTCFDDRKAKQL